MCLENQSKRSDTNWPVQLQKLARSLKFPMLEEEDLNYPCSKIKGADQLCCYFFTVFSGCGSLNNILFHTFNTKLFKVGYQCEQLQKVHINKCIAVICVYEESMAIIF